MSPPYFISAGRAAINNDAGKRRNLFSSRFNLVSTSNGGSLHPVLAAKAWESKEYFDKLQILYDIVAASIREKDRSLLSNTAASSSSSLFRRAKNSSCLRVDRLCTYILSDYCTIGADQPVKSHKILLSTADKGYVNMLLGRDKHGHPVTVGAHVLLCYYNMGRPSRSTYMATHCRGAGCKQNKACVNPTHLKWASSKSNSGDREDTKRGKHTYHGYRHDAVEPGMFTDEERAAIRRKRGYNDEMGTRLSRERAGLGLALDAVATEGSTGRVLRSQAQQSAAAGGSNEADPSSSGTNGSDSDDDSETDSDEGPQDVAPRVIKREGVMVRAVRQDRE